MPPLPTVISGYSSPRATGFKRLGFFPVLITIEYPFPLGNFATEIPGFMGKPLKPPIPHIAVREPVNSTGFSFANSFIPLANSTAFPGAAVGLTTVSAAIRGAPKTINPGRAAIIVPAPIPNCLAI